MEYNCRPIWLKNPYSKRNLELDLFFPNLGIAFEINGMQHFRYTPHFHRNGIEDFHYQVFKDNWKKEMCRLKGIQLFIIDRSTRLESFLPPLETIKEER